VLPSSGFIVDHKCVNLIIDDDYFHDLYHHKLQKYNETLFITLNFNLRTTERLFKYKALKLLYCGYEFLKQGDIK
jgi:hypothetical protein